MDSLYLKIKKNVSVLSLSLFLPMFAPGAYASLSPGSSFSSFFWTQGSDSTVNEGCYGKTRVDSLSEKDGGYLSTFWLTYYEWWQKLFTNTYINITINAKKTKPAEITRAPDHLANSEWLTGFTRNGSNDHIRFYFPMLSQGTPYGRYDYFTVNVNDTVDLEFYGAGDSIMVGTFVHKLPDSRGAVRILGRNAVIVELTDSNPLRIKNIRCNGIYKKLINDYLEYDLETFAKDKAWYGVSIIDTAPAVPKVVISSVTVEGEPELHAGSTAKISWGCNLPPDVDSSIVQYSLDNKNSWSRAGKVASSALSLSWKVPLTVSDAAYIKVVSYPKSGGTASGQSSVFTIVSDIAVQSISIEGTSQLIPDSTYSVTWHLESPLYVDSCVASVSYDNAVWDIIGKSSTGTSIDWKVPNIETDSVAVRVVAYGKNGKTYSDTLSDLAILSRTVINSVTIGSEAPLDADSSYTIAWSYNFPSSVDSSLIEVSYDNKTSWNTIGTRDSGCSYLWKVPNVKSDSAYIKLSAYCNDGIKVTGFTPVFTVRPKIIISSVTITDTTILKADSAYDISWNVNFSSAIDSCLIAASFDNLKTWKEIGRTDSGSAFSWTIPNVLSDSTVVRIDAYDKYGRKTSGFSRRHSVLPEITVDSLTVAGASPLVSDSTYAISWKLNFPTEADSCLVAASFDNKKTWQAIGRVDSCSVLGWKIPVIASDSTCIRITVFGKRGQVVTVVSDSIYAVDPGAALGTIIGAGKELAPSMRPVASGRALKINYTLPRGARKVSISIFDLQGRCIERCHEVSGRIAERGVFQIGNNVNSGYYYIRFLAEFNNGKPPLLMTKKWVNMH